MKAERPGVKPGRYLFNQEYRYFCKRRRPAGDLLFALSYFSYLCTLFRNNIRRKGNNFLTAEMPVRFSPVLFCTYEHS